MDWKRAIDINHAALTRVVGNLVAMVESFAGEDGARLSRSFYGAVLLVLLPAESAVRRLIIMAARGIRVTLAPPRAAPEGKLKGKSVAAARKLRQTEALPSFRLFDTRKRFGETRPWGSGRKPVPRVYFIDAPPPIVPLFQLRVPAVPEPEPDQTVSTARLSQRLAAIKHALETLPEQAQRMARWRARRALLKNPKFKSPLRPGPPPGHRKRSRDPVDEILKDCHAFAWEALHKDTS